MRLEDNLGEAIDIMTTINSSNSYNVVTSAYKVISKTGPNMAEKAYFKLKNQPKTTNRSRKRIVCHSWWYKEIELLFIRVKLSYTDYKNSLWLDSTSKPKYYDAKKEFRKRKRYNQKIKRNRTFRLLDDLFKSDKNNFWKKIARMERSGVSVNIDIEKVKEAYRNTITESNRSEDVEDDDWRKAND